MEKKWKIIIGIIIVLIFIGGIMTLNFGIIRNTLFDDEFGIASDPKERIWTRHGNSYMPVHPDVDDIDIGADPPIKIVTGPVSLSTQVDLPDGAVILSYIIYGNAGSEGEQSVMTRVDTAGTVTNLGTGNPNTRVTVISNETVDNTNYAYSIHINNLDDNDEIYLTQVVYSV